MKRSQYIFLGALFIIIIAIAHTSMVMFDAMGDTALKEVFWARILLSILVSASTECSVLVYIREGKKLPSVINAIFSVVLYLCAVQPFSGLETETYLSIGKMVFGVSIGLNMWFYSELFRSSKEEEKTELGRVGELEELIEIKDAQYKNLSDSKDDLIKESEQLREKVESSVHQLEQGELLLEQAESALEQQKEESEQRFQLAKQSLLEAKKEQNIWQQKYKTLEQETTCVCGYKASLQHHQSKCTEFQNKSVQNPSTSEQV